MSQPQAQQPKRELTALQHAEILEKQKLVEDRQRKLQNIAKSTSHLNQKDIALKRERGRVAVTLKELTNYPETQVVYRSVGRMFLKKPLATMKEDYKAMETRFHRDIEKNDEDKKRLQTAQEGEEIHLRQDYAEFVQTLEKYGLATRN